MPTTATSPGSGAKPDRKPPLPRAIYALFFVRLVVSAGSFVQPFLAMILTMKLGWDGSRSGAFLSLVAGVSALGLLAGGKLGDAFGSRRVLAFLQSLAALTFVASAVLGFGPWTPVLVAAALGFLSGSWPAINALVADHAPPERRREAFSLLYWGNNIGFSIGPTLAGLLFVSAPRLLFAGNAAVLLVAAFAVLAFVPELAGRPDAPSLPVRGGTGREAGSRGAPAEGDGIAIGRSSTLAIFRADPVLAVYALLAVLTAFVYDQHRFALPLTLAEAFGGELGPRVFGYAMTVNGLTVVVATAIVTLASHRLPSLAAVALGSVFYAIGFGAYGVASGIPAFLGITAFWTLGEILGATNGNAFVAERAPETHRGRVNAAVSLSHVAGNMAAPLVAGPLADAFGPRAVWAPIAVIAAVGALGLFALSAWNRARGPGSLPTRSEPPVEASGQGTARESERDAPS